MPPLEYELLLLDDANVLGWKKNMYQTKTYIYSHAAFKRLSTVNYFDKKAPL